MTEIGLSLAVLPELADNDIRVSTRLLWLANRIAAYCLLNLLDDPALLAMAFC